MLKNIKKIMTLKIILLISILGVIIGVLGLIINMIFAIIGSFGMPEIGLTYRTTSSFFSLPVKINQGLEGGETFGGLSDIKTFDVNSLGLSELKISGLFLGNTKIKIFENNMLLSSFNRKVFEDSLEGKKWYIKEDGENVTYIIIDEKKTPFVIYANPRGKVFEKMKDIYFSKDLFFLSKVNSNIDSYYFIFKKNTTDFNYPYIMNYGVILQGPNGDIVLKEIIDQKIVSLNEIKDEIKKGEKDLYGLTEKDIDDEIKNLVSSKSKIEKSDGTKGNISNLKFDTSILFDLLSVKGNEVSSIPLFGYGISVVKTQIISCKKQSREVVIGSLAEGEKKFSFKSEKLKGKEKEFESLYDIKYKVVKVCGGNYIGEIILNKKGFDNSSFENISTFDKTYLTLNGKNEFNEKVRGVENHFFKDVVQPLTSDNITYALERSVEFMNSYFYKGSISPGTYTLKNSTLSNDKYIFTGTNGQLGLDINPTLLVHSFIQTYKNENKDFSDMFEIEGFLTADNGMNISKYISRYGENVMPIIFDLNKGFGSFKDGYDFFYNPQDNSINKGLEKPSYSGCVYNKDESNVCEKSVFKYNINNVVLGINTFGQNEGKYTFLTSVKPTDSSWFGLFSSLKEGTVSQTPITITNGLGYNDYRENSFTGIDDIYTEKYKLDYKTLKRIFENVRGFANNQYFIEKVDLLNKNKIYLPDYLENTKPKIEEEKKKYSEFYYKAIQMDNVKTLFTGSGFYSFDMENDLFLDYVKGLGLTKLKSCQLNSTSIDIDKIDQIKQTIRSNRSKQIDEEYSKKVEEFINSLKNNYYPCTYIELRKINSPDTDEEIPFEMPEDGLEITTKFASYQLSKVNLFVDASVSKLKEIEDEYNRKIKYIELTNNQEEKKKLNDIKRTIDIIKDMVSVSGINSGDANIMVVLSDLQIYSKLLKEFSNKESTILDEYYKNFNTLTVPYKVCNKYSCLESNNTKNIILNLISERKREKELINQIKEMKNNPNILPEDKTKKIEELKMVKSRINNLQNNQYSEYLKNKQNDENKDVTLKEGKIEDYIKIKIKEGNFNQYIVTLNPNLFESITNWFYDIWTDGGNKDVIMYYNTHVFYKGLIDMKIELDKNQDVFSGKRYGLTELDKGFGTFGKYYFPSYNEGKIIIKKPEITEIFGTNTSFNTSLNDSIVNLEESFKNEIMSLTYNSPEITSLFQSGGIYGDALSIKDNAFHKMLSSTGITEYLQEKYPDKLNLYKEVYSDLYNKSIWEIFDSKKIKLNYYYSMVDILKTLYIDKYVSFDETNLPEFVLPPDSLLMLKYQEYKTKRGEIVSSMSSIINYSSSIQKKTFNTTIDSWKSYCSLLPMESDRLICNGYINYLKSKGTMKSFLQEIEYSKSVTYLVKLYNGRFPITSETNYGKNVVIGIQPYKRTNGGLIGQCVWYISVKKDIPQQGNANMWGKTKDSINIITKRGGKIINPRNDSESIQKIKKGDILTFDGGSYGHVVVIENIDILKREITISENNFGTTGITTIRTIPFDGITGLFITNIKDKYITN